MSRYSNHVTEVEIYDDTNGLAATVRAFDEAAAHVEIKTVTCGTYWPELSAAILAALAAMKLAGDDAGRGGA